MGHYDSHRSRKDKERRQSVYEKYEPIVLWVKADNVETGRGMHDPPKIIRRELKESVDDMLFVDVAHSNEPWNVVVTEFDDAYELLVENSYV